MAELFPGTDWFSPKAPSSAKYWIQEVRIHSKLEQDAVIRSIPMQRGLNIVWARPSNPDESQASQRGRGHAAGKTSFCRLLRFLLGERFYCGEQMRHRLSKTEGLEAAWVLGQIIVDSISWAVARPLYPGAHPFALKNQPLDAIFTTPASGRLRFEAFTDELGKAVLKGFEIRHFDESERRPIEWPHILQWLSRDQECHLEGLLKWRTPSSGHESPDMSGGDDHLLVRAILGITEAGERKEIGVRKNLRLDEDQAKASMQFSARFISETLELFKDELPEVTIPEKPAEDLLFLDLVRRKSGEKAVSRASDLQKQLNELKVQETRAHYELQLGRKAILENELTQFTDKLAEIRTKVARYNENRGKANEHERRGVDEEFLNSLKPGPNYCEIPVSIALFQCPIYLNARMREQHQPEEAKLESFAKEALEQARAVESALQADCDRARARLAGVLTEFGEARRQLEQIEGQARSLEIQIRRQSEEPALWLYRAQEVAKAAERYALLEGQIAEIHNQLKASQERQETARQFSSEKRDDLSKIFQKLCQFIKGDEVMASLSFGREKISSSMALLGELDSDAYKALSCILFDVAAVVARFHGIGHHPGFLIHDSPRESDMEPSLYRPIFQLAQKLESIAPDSFQYVITTTEPPPAGFEQSGHIILELDGSKEDGRLYRKHLAA